MNPSRYSASDTQLSPGWTFDAVLEPSALFGANGMRVGPDGALYVAQAFGSQVSALDIDSGAARTIVPVGSDVVAPDDLAFDSHGVMYMTEVMSERVSARLPDGSLRVIAENVPVANGITIHGDRIFMDEFRVGGRVMELYADGRAPRIIAENLIMPNALAMGPDGALYFPQVSEGEIWRVATEGGTPERVMAGLALPTAVKFSPSGELFTVEAGTGDVTRIDLQSRSRTVVARVRPGIDNFAFTPEGRLFVSHFIDGGVAEIDQNGGERVLVAAGLLGPFGLASAPDGTLYVADGMSLAVVGANGQLSARPALLLNHDFPGFARGVAVGTDGACYVSTSGGTVARYAPGEDIRVIAADLGNISGLTQARDGSFLVCDTGGGRVLEVSPAGVVKTIAQGLHGPLGVVAAADGSCFVSEADGGRVSHIKGGEVSAVLSGLVNPHGLALRGESLFVLDRGAKSVLQLTLATGHAETIASGLPVGAEPGLLPKVLPGIADLLPGPLLPFADLTVSADGRILISADGAGAIFALAQKPL
jgi:sugar lactone lactonase YvrE